MNFRSSLFNIIGILIIVYVIPYSLKGQEVETSETTSDIEMLTVKFKDNLPLSITDGKITLPSAHPAKEFLVTVATLGNYQKMIQGIEERVIDSLRSVAQQFWDSQAREREGLSRRIVADMNNYYFLSLSNTDSLDKVIRILNQCPYVVHAYKSIRPASSPNFSPPGNFVPNQTYLNALDGINANYVYNEYATKGEGFKVVDIEFRFNPFHYDLPPVGLVPNTRSNYRFGDDRSHGTGVLGVLFSKDDGVGTNGIVPGAQALFSAAHDINGNYNVSNSLIQSVLATGIGDVILIEQQIVGPNFVQGSQSQVGFVPVEYDISIYDAVVMAVGNSRVVVETGGNGSQDINDSVNIQGNVGHYPFLDANDSGAIIVGAGASSPNGSSTSRSRLGYSNYGERVDLQGFGENIWTTGTGNAYSIEGENYFYTSTFGGTSGAGPIVAGAAVLLQSVYQKTHGQILNSFEVRDLLVQGGKPQQGGTHPVSQKIGPLPDLAASTAGLSDGELFIQSTSFNTSFTDSGNNYGYADFTQSQPLLWQAGQSIPISLTLDGQGDIFPAYWRVWADLNQDGVFDDTNELLLDSGPVNGSSYNTNLELLDNISGGTTRLRVSVNTQSAPDACGVHNGEVEDYTVNILEAPFLIVLPDMINFGENGGSHQINIQSNVNWISSADNIPWLTIQGNNSGMNNGSFTLVADPNPNTVPRSDILLVEGGGGLTAVIEVTQEAQGNGNITPPWGEPIPTTFSGVLLGQAQIEGLPAGTSDWVAAFDEGGNLAGANEVVMFGGIAYINLVIYGDDPATSVDEGINTGEGFTLQLWDVSENRILDYPFTGAPTVLSGWANTNGAPMPGFQVADIYNFRLSTMDVIPLEAGWNLVSTDVIPADSSVATIMSGLLPGNLEYVTGFDGAPSFYDPSIPPFLSTLTSWERGFGYWVKVLEQDTIFVPGQLIDVDYFKPMDEGWNLIAYLPQSSQPVDMYLAGFLNDGDVEYVTAGNNGYYDPFGQPFLNTLTTMENSKGYWMKTFEGNNVNAGIDNRGEEQQIANPIYEFVWGYSNAKEGDEIKIIDSDNKEWAVLEVGENGVIWPKPLYGDYAASERTEGPSIGTKLYFSLDGSLADEEIIFSGDMLLSKVSLNFMQQVENSLQLFPSPFRDELTMRYHIPKAGETTIVIIDALGREVWRNTSVHTSAGWHQQEWSPESSQNGIYFIAVSQKGVQLNAGRALLQK